MKLMIAGSRSITDFDLSSHIPYNVDTIISGGAKGIDMLAEQYAIDRKLSRYIILPNYSRYGKAAPIKRNQEMVDMADVVLVVWDGKSKGTLSTINYTKTQQKQLILITV